MLVTDSNIRHYKELGREQKTLVASARKAWGQVEPDYIVDSWSQIVDQSFLPAMSRVQERAAASGAAYSAGVLADQGFWVAPTGWVDPAGLAGVNPRGGVLRNQLLAPAYHSLRLISQGAKAGAALAAVLPRFMQMVSSVLTDTSRAAAQMDITGRPRVGYVRVVHASACDRCVILAGKFYRWNEGFLRHPQCRCEHVATDKAHSDDLFDDPYKVFESLTEEDQNARWGEHEAQAIRDGADIYQVTNARRGMVPSGMFTTEGMARGHSKGLLKDGQRRLTPEGVYKLSKGNRETALGMLKEHGYILDGGQVPGGSLRGRVAGYGQHGKGGKASAAREAVETAIDSGKRDPRNRYTMTAAEQRLFDAETRYRLVLEGKNPFDSPGFGQTPDPYGEGLNIKGKPQGRPLTPRIAAMVEQDYRRWLTSGGQIYTE